MSLQTTCVSVASRSARRWRAFLEAHDTIVVVEQNRDAQLRTLFTLETPVPKEKLRSVLAYGGYPLSAEDVVDGVTKILAA